MRLLLDTHVWIWSLVEPERVHRDAERALRSPDNELWLSPVSVWEAMLLAERGRIGVRAGARAWVREALSQMPLRDAPFSREVAIASRELAIETEDPGDRFIAATADHLGLVVTADAHLLACPVETLQAA